MKLSKKEKKEIIRKEKENEIVEAQNAFLSGKERKENGKIYKKS